LNYVLTAERTSYLICFFQYLGIEHDLNYAFPITQVDEYLPTVVTTPMHPAS
jgi:hypothetical protein